MKEKPLCGYATVQLPLKPNHIFCFMKTNLFTFHVYKNLLELVKKS